jgi:ubiquitin-protein ligase
MSRKAGEMRLNREAKMAKKDIEAQIKKSGKITDNFICLPNPENVYEWWYIVFGLVDPDEYTGGYYLGKVTCPQDYPSKAPNITLINNNGKYRTIKQQPDGICLSISDFHQESWNPAWKVTQIVTGLVSFWLDDEYTYGSVESYDYNESNREVELSEKDHRINWAMQSRDEVKKHEKFEQIFAPYADAIGINEPADLPVWIELKQRIEKAKAAKIQAAKEKKEREEREAIEKQKREEEENKRYLKENFHTIIGNYFIKLKNQGIKVLGNNPKVLKHRAAVAV